jgi:heme/copper-type cytochrome/quinol oxidase subunit 1
LILPGFGIVSHIIQNLQKNLSLVMGMVYAMISIGVLGFIGAHHYVHGWFRY